MFLLRNGDIFIILKRIGRIPHKGIGSQRMVDFRLCWCDVSGFRRELPVNTHKVSLAFLLLQFSRRVNTQPPFPIHKRHLKGIISQRVRVCLSQHALPILIPHDDIHVNMIHRVMFAILLQCAVQIHLVLNGLRLAENVTLRHQPPVIAPPPLCQHQHVRTSAVFSIILLKIIIHMGYIPSHFRRQQHPRLHIALLAVRHRMSIHGRKRQVCMRLCLQLHLHLSAWFQSCSLSHHVDIVSRVRFWTFEEEAFCHDSS